MKRYIIYTIVMMFAVLQASAQTSVNYTYDDLNRLTEVNYSNGVKVRYTYDALGNRMTRTVTTSQSQQLRGDVDDDGEIGISDISVLIDYLLTGNTSLINISNADCDQSGGVSIEDLSALIDYLLRGNWTDYKKMSLGRNIPLKE